MNPTKRIIFALVLALTLLLPCVLPAMAGDADPSGVVEPPYAPAINIINHTKEAGDSGARTVLYPDIDRHMYTAQASGYVTFTVSSAGLTNVIPLTIKTYIAKAGSTVYTIRHSAEQVIEAGGSYSVEEYVKYGETLRIDVIIGAPSPNGDVSLMSAGNGDAPSAQVYPAGYYKYRFSTDKFFFAQHTVEPNFFANNLANTYFPANSSLPIYKVNSESDCNTSLLSKDGCALLCIAMVLRNKHKMSDIKLNKDIRDDTQSNTYVLADPYTIIMFNNGNPQNVTWNSSKGRYEVSSGNSNPSQVSWSNLFYTVRKDNDPAFKMSYSDSTLGSNPAANAKTIAEKLASHPEGVIVGFGSREAGHFVVVVSSTYTSSVTGNFGNYFYIIDPIRSAKYDKPIIKISEDGTLSDYGYFNGAYRIITLG